MALDGQTEGRTDRRHGQSYIPPPVAGDNKEIEKTMLVSSDIKSSGKTRNNIGMDK